ncbi:MAG TPA: FimV/HubP family polar landmark protein [Cellvibrionaceae bacterium]
MGLRKQTIFLSLISTLASPWAMSLGLGEIKLKSTLNQPLNAEIQLTQTKDLTDREILVGLASAADFARVGVDKPLFLGDLKFQVVMEPGKGPLVRITSSKAVVEPYLNFIVQAQWPSGKLLREYTVLVDLPVYGGNEADSVAPAVSRAASATPKVETQLTQTDVPRPRVSRPAAATARPKTPRPAPVADEPPIDAKPSGDTYGPVAGNDTLWKIARSNRPSGASIQQTMLAIQKLNPDAFINGNINLLRKGQTLRLPAADAASQVAVDEAARQVAANSPRKAPSDESTGPQLDASKSVAKTEPKSSALEGRVKLSSSNSAESSKSGRGAGADKGSKEALSNELTITKEELDAKSRESADLNVRLKAVDEQIENTEKLIQVNSEEMRKLELAIEKNKQNQTAGTVPVVPNGTDAPVASTEVPAAISADGKVVAPADSANATATIETPATGTSQSETPKVEDPVETPPSPPVQPSVEPKPAATPAPAKPAAQEGLVDLLKNNVLYIGAGLAVLLGLGLLLLKRRRNDDDGPEPWVGASDNSDGGWGNDFSLPGFEETKPVDTKITDADDITQFQLTPASQSVKLETDDVVSESDIHIALEDYDTAEKLLLSSLEQDPANSRVLLKLLEVYSRKQDVESFDRQYAKLKAFCDEESAARAEQLRSYIDNAPPFDGHKYSDEAFLAAVNGKVESDDTTQLTPLAAAAIGATVASAGFAAEPFANFDFDAKLEEPAAFDSDDMNSGDSTQFTTPVADSDESFTLDFEDAVSAEAIPAGDRKSLAELLIDEGGEDSLDLSDFDDLSFDKGAEPNTSLDDPFDAKQEQLPELDFSFDSEGLDESDFELDENALGGDFETVAADELHLDSSLDAGFDDLDEPVVQAPVVEPVDEFADLDLSALDYDFSDQDLDAEPEVDLSMDDALGDKTTLDLDDEIALTSNKIEGAPQAKEDEFDFSVDDLNTQQDLSVAMAELDALDEQTFDLDDAFSVADEELTAAELQNPIVEESPASSAKRAELESLLDFDESFGELETASLGEFDQDEPNTPTLVMSAITDSDLPTEDLDFDELDADLGALAAEFDGDLSDLDDLDSPTLAEAPSRLMAEPVTQFGELDDVDPADILGDGPKDRPDIDLEGFDDSVKFSIEDPLTDLDADFDIDEKAPGAAVSSSKDFAAVAAELGTAVNVDSSDELMEFEGLDNLDDLSDLDLDDALALDLDEEELNIPRASFADIEADFQLPDFDPESDDDSDLGALCDGDELDTKLDLLRAFVDMGDEDSAKHTLEEIMEEGSEEQRKQANALMARIS